MLVHHYTSYTLLTADASCEHSIQLTNCGEARWFNQKKNMMSKFVLTKPRCEYTLNELQDLFWKAFPQYKRKT